MDFPLSPSCFFKEIFNKSELFAWYLLCDYLRKVNSIGPLHTAVFYKMLLDLQNLKKHK
jgi:hypothetical protein